jgi:hypothetical protein
MAVFERFKQFYVIFIQCVVRSALRLRYSFCGIDLGSLRCPFIRGLE